MNYLTDRTQESNFLSFILKEKQNRTYLGIALAGIIIQLVIFKILYPFADYFSDSYSYIYAAATGRDVNIWPIGYSKFLALFHVITHSDTAVVAFQYLFVELTSLYFFFTVLYFYSPVRRTAIIIFIFLFFNPLFLYLSNYISSDALFLGLSMWWLVQLLWIIHRPSPYQIITHTLVITIAFTVRYNAIYYPFITALAFIISRRSLTLKVIGIGLPLILIYSFINYTEYKSQEITGTKQFSVFSGWQIANNAMYMYPHIQVNDKDLPIETQQLARQTKQFFDTLGFETINVTPAKGAYFIKHSNAPLKQALYAYWSTDTLASDVKAWGKVSPMFSKFGTALIKKHPIAFLRYYLLPNAANYLVPPLEKMEVYNLGKDVVSPIAAQWFGYSSLQIRFLSSSLQGSLLILESPLFMLLQLMLIAALLWLFFSGQLKRTSTSFRSGLLLIGILLLTNCLFSILASPIVFRYQIFPMILFLTFGLLLVDYAIQFSNEDEKAKEHTPKGAGAMELNV
ncbi:hypothetical protein [Chitinophaga vietnamensis]|uniref:hypothetical protein n=1 Tax=Chitinophaga vietnamensis TaxID=2593957 RepID=UPI00117818BD|nr:hypothetical protein [Chitinophaga vietnamensis]